MLRAAFLARLAVVLLWALSGQGSSIMETQEYVTLVDRKENRRYFTPYLEDPSSFRGGVGTLHRLRSWPLFSIASLEVRSHPLGPPGTAYTGGRGWAWAFRNARRFPLLKKCKRLAVPVRESQTTAFPKASSFQLIHN